MHEEPRCSALAADESDLQTVLAAWHAATLRLEQTHEALRAEVRRLTDELAVKNRELARKNRLADLGQMAAHIAHEVRNNLVPVSLYLSLLRRRVATDAGSLAALAKVEAGIGSLGATVNDLLNFAAERDPKLEAIELKPLAADVLGSLAPQIAAQAIQTAVEVPDTLAVRADREMLRRAVLNIALNAIDAMPAGGRLVVAGRATPEAIEIELADSGPGLSEEARRRAFEPFFTTKRNGTGLGLAIVYRVAECHGGEVFVGPGRDGGAAFTIRLPQGPEEAAA
ncbi:MAG TPA: ATP-binding protein [Pirellulales bacterium]|nr:ATP-binding protein [Pirellulales bacterium]